MAKPTSRIIRALGVDEVVKCGKTTLPGILNAISVNGSLELQEDVLEDKSKAEFVVQGFTTQKVQLTLLLTGTQKEVYQQIREIQTIFQVERTKRKKLGDRATKLYPFRIVSPHLDARRIKMVLFDNFTTDEGDSDDAIRCTLSFHEFDADVAKLEDKELERQKRAKAEAENAKNTPSNNPLKNGGGKPSTGNGSLGPLQGLVEGVKSGVNGVNTAVKVVQGN